MTNLKRVFLVMVAIVLLGATVVFATDGSDTVIVGDETPTNTTTIDSGNTLATGNTSNYNATNTNGNLPQTGENDYIYVLVIGAFAISAVYAYKKIVDYKSI